MKKGGGRVVKKGGGGVCEGGSIERGRRYCNMSCNILYEIWRPISINACCV